jgi:ribose-phosphate pyrophosphokinase
MAQSLASLLGGNLGGIEARQFPDKETYLRLKDDPGSRTVILVCTLRHPNKTIVPLLFAAETARDLGATHVGLVAPYLAYMRQDARFHPGEAITSQIFARLVSGSFDWLVTADPHLHRYGSLADVYKLPFRIAKTAPAIAHWIRENVPNAIIIGPDSESKQWVADVARDARVPFAVMDKARAGDRDVTVNLGDVSLTPDHTPVLVDDIISSGRTMLAALTALERRTTQAPICIGVHAVFADQVEEEFARVGARLITCNTVPHPTNTIDVASLLAVEAQPFLCRL